ncbi:zinc finger Y-chromosomal protein 1 isoform X2 [Aplysia californica]|uniref:Zinc finger Y-chromosomal protein 1 isoform X2 n=1 Tax=Aplysia californica TaxID=6500 RepID=A0ABM0JJ60_APLCA|nr:zinc finger Y-chromosomal protein 1 isoform X2 [Aplysia californica]
MDYDSSTKFISSLAKFLQSLCNGYVEFDNGVQVIGHLYLSVDTGKTIDYVLNEKVCKTDENSVTFISNSFHAQPAERPKPQGKRTARDRQDVKSEDKDNNSVEQIEPRSTNHGTVQTARGSGENSPLGNNGKRPLSPSQRQFKDDASLSGRVSPRSKKSRTDSFDQNTSHPSNLNNENSISSAPSPAGDSGPASMSAQNSDAPQDSSYSESYQQQTFFPPSEEEHSVGGSERDIKPSLDTDVTFIKEEYAPSSCSQSDTQGRDRNQVEDSSMYPTMFPSSHSYPSGAYAGHGNYGASTPGSQRSNFSSSSDRHSGMYASGQSSTQLEPGENTSDPSATLRRPRGRPRRSFACPVCSKECVTNMGLRRHFRREHPARTTRADPHSNNLKGSNSKADLQGDRASFADTSSFLFRCGFCHQGFGDYVSLADHLLTIDLPGSGCSHSHSQHGAAGVFYCGICEADLSFTSAALMITHLEEVHYLMCCPEPSTPGPSSITGSADVRLGESTSHAREDKRYACHHCSNSYSDMKGLRRHLAKVNGVRYQCDLCHRDFSREDVYARHRKDMHRFDV